MALPTPELVAAPPVGEPALPALRPPLPPTAAVPAGHSLREQIREDPRSNTPRRSLETRIAAAVGTPDLTEERMDATRQRVWQNGRCVEVHVARNTQIDPWNQSAQATPKLVKPCE